LKKISSLTKKFQCWATLSIRLAWWITSPLQKDANRHFDKEEWNYFQLISIIIFIFDSIKINDGKRVSLKNPKIKNLQKKEFLTGKHQCHILNKHIFLCNLTKIFKKFQI